MSESKPNDCDRVPAAICPLLRVLWLAVFVPVFFSARGLAQDGAGAKRMDLTQVPLEALMEIDVAKVSSASKFEQKETEAPASVTVITSDEIKRYGYRTLAEVLNSAPGFLVSDDRNYSFLGVRGINLGDFNSRVLLLVDGHRVNNNLTDGALIGNDFILDLDLVDQVEIVRGAGSVLYGNNAFLGVINVVTRKPRDLNGFEVSGEYGGFDTYKARVSYGKAFTNGLELLLSGSLYDSAGAERLFYKEFNTPAQNNGIAQGIDREGYGSVFGSLSYHDFTLEGAFIHRKKDNPTAQFLTTFNDPRLKTVDERGYLNLKFVHSFEDIFDMTAQLYYDRNDFSIGYPLGVPGASTFFREKQLGEWFGTELQLSRRLWDKHTLSVGAEYRDDFHLHDRIYDAFTGMNFSDTNRTRQSYGVYAEGDLALRDNLHASGGVRYDQAGDFGPSFNPRLALIYNPFEKSALKAIYGTAFRAPNFLELSDPRFQDIQPERITSYELVYEQGIGKHLRSSVDGFYNQMHDLIVFQNGKFVNLNANSTGVEMALEASWANGLRGRASYTLQKTENRSESQNLPDSPHHLVKLNLSMPLYQDKIFAGLEAQFTGSRSTLFTTTSGTTLPGTDVGAFAVLNLTLFSKNLMKNLDFSVSVYNLLDEQYADPATRFHLQDQIPQDGRSFRLKVSYRF